MGKRPIRKIPRVMAGMFGRIDQLEKERRAAAIAKPMRNLMDLLASGEAYEIGGQVVMRMPEIDKVFAERAEWVEVAPAVEGWIDCWQRMAPDLGSYHLGVLAQRLSAGKEITERLVQQARAEFDAHVARLPEIPADQVKSAITTTQIAWEFEKTKTRTPMNAPEIITETINAAHAVLMQHDEALNADRIAFEINGRKKANKTQVKEAVRQLQHLAGLGLIEMEPRAGGVPFYRLIVASESLPTKTYPPETLRAMVAAHEAEKACDTWSEFILLGVIADIRAAIGDTGQIMLGDLAAQIGEVAQERARLKAENLALKTLNEAMPGFGAEHQEQRIDSLTKDVINTRTALTNALNEANRLRAELAAERQAREALQEQSDAVDVKDAAVGYLIRVTKRKPRYVTQPERARDAALAAVRAGAGRAEVLAVVPVGVARRGAEWRGSNPMGKGD